MLSLRMLSVLLMLGLVYGCDDIPNPFVDASKKADQAKEAGDMETAAHWYTKAAEQGDANAQKNLGWMYANGKGVAEDKKQAVYWHTKAAEQGDAYAQNQLGWIYQNGEGVAGDVKEAVYWYKKAAEQGYSYAQFNLAFAYRYGNGVDVDSVKAHVWLSIAAAGGNEYAKANRKAVEKVMWPSQIVKAKEMARECEAKNYKGC